jgi:hypothetical protein
MEGCKGPGSFSLLNAVAVMYRPAVKHSHSQNRTLHATARNPLSQLAATSRGSAPRAAPSCGRGAAGSVAQTDEQEIHPQVLVRSAHSTNKEQRKRPARPLPSGRADGRRWCSLRRRRAALPAGACWLTLTTVR